jgi:hypothetical protein
VDGSTTPPAKIFEILSGKRISLCCNYSRKMPLFSQLLPPLADVIKPIL